MRGVGVVPKVRASARQGSALGRPPSEGVIPCHKVILKVIFILEIILCEKFEFFLLLFFLI
jgi:hypothetical protein